MNKYFKIKFETINDVKCFSNKILNIDTEATIRTENRKYAVDAKSIMGIFSLDLTRHLILEMEGDEEQFVKDIKNMGIFIEPTSIGA